MVGADQESLPHVRHVEQAGGGAYVQMLRQNAVLILDRHVVAGETGHLRAKRDMQRMQRRLLERNGS